jgi:hypothetical protein
LPELSLLTHPDAISEIISFSFYQPQFSFNFSIILLIHNMYSISSQKLINNWHPNLW